MRYLGLTWTGLSAFNPSPTRASTIPKAARSKPIGRVAVFSNGAGFPGVRSGTVATLPRFPLQRLLAAWTQTT
jgi:hypothetical protein